MKIYAVEKMVLFSMERCWNARANCEKFFRQDKWFFVVVNFAHRLVIVSGGSKLGQKCRVEWSE
jgi:hypothetical protein